MRIETYTRIVYEIDDIVMVNSNIDLVYSDYIGTKGRIISTNDDNSFTVLIDEDNNDVILLYSHEFDIVDDET